MRFLSILGTALFIAFANQAVAQEYDYEDYGIRLGVGIENNAMKKNGKPPHSDTVFSFDENKTLARIFIGYDAKIFDENIVLGAEIGRSLGKKSLTQTVSNLKYDYEMEPIIDFSARLGVYLTDNILVYGRYGFDNLTMTQTTKLGTAAAKVFEDTKTLGHIGLGAEYHFKYFYLIRGEWSKVTYKSSLENEKFSISFGVRY